MYIKSKLFEQAVRGDEPGPSVRGNDNPPSVRGNENNRPRRTVPPTNTVQPNPTNPEEIKKRFPECVKNGQFSDYSKTSDGEYDVAQSGSYIIFKKNEIQVFRDRSKKSPFNEGEWYCENNIIKYSFYESEVEEKEQVNLDVVYTNSIKYLGFNPFEQIAGGTWVIDTDKLEEASNYLGTKIDKFYQGRYIRNFLLGLKEVNKIAVVQNDANIQNKIKNNITTINNKINGATTNFQTKFGDALEIELNPKANPTDLNGYVKLDLSTVDPWTENQSGGPLLYVLSSVLDLTTTKRQERQQTISNFLKDYTGTTENCVNSLSFMLDTYKEYCNSYDPNNRFGVCSPGTGVLKNLKNLDIRQIKFAVSLCNTQLLFSEGNLKKFFEQKYKEEPGGLLSGKKRKIEDAVNFVKQTLNAMQTDNVINLSKKIEGRNVEWTDQPKESVKSEKVLKETIKKVLIKKSEEKKIIMAESTIVKNRFNIILESRSIKKRKDLNELYLDILSEMVLLHKQGYNSKIIVENVEGIFGVLSNLLGGGSGVMDAVAQTFKEKGVNWILNKLGLSSDSYLKDLLITSLGNVDLVDIPKLFSDCDFLTSKIAESIPEAYLRQIQRDKGLDGMFGDAIRNALYNTIKNSDFGEKVKGAISGIVCGLVDQMGGIFSGRFDQMKSSILK